MVIGGWGKGRWCLCCALCEMEMLRTCLGEVEIDLCILCGGIFLDEGEFTRLSGLALGGIPRAPGREMTCPGCSGTMEELSVSGVEIDLCPSCGGVWLDHHELNRFSSIDHEVLDRNRVISFIEAKERLMTAPQPGSPERASRATGSGTELQDEDEPQ